MGYEVEHRVTIGGLGQKGTILPTLPPVTGVVIAGTRISASWWGNKFTGEVKLSVSVPSKADGWAGFPSQAAAQAWVDSYRPVVVTPTTRPTLPPLPPSVIDTKGVITPGAIYWVGSGDGTIVQGTSAPAATKVNPQWSMFTDVLNAQKYSTSVKSLKKPIIPPLPPVVTIITGTTGTTTAGGATLPVITLPTKPSNGQITTVVPVTGGGTPGAGAVVTTQPGTTTQPAEATLFGIDTKWLLIGGAIFVMFALSGADDSRPAPRRRYR